MRLPARYALIGLLLVSPSIDATAQDLLPAPAEAEGSAEQAPKEIPLASPPDAAIEDRISGIFSRLEGLQNLRVDVSNGVVRLTGTTLTGNQRERAEEIAARISGVVAVDNQIEAEANINRRAVPLISQAREFFWYVLSRLPLLLLALAAVVAFWLFGWVITRGIRLFRRLAPNAFIETLLEQIVRIAFLVLGLVVAMNVLGATALMASIFGAAGLIGLAIGFAVRDTIENYIASILLSLRQPFAPGDFVSIEENEGHVVRLNSRATMLMTLDGNEVRIPNATVYKTIIINYTRMPERRFEFEVGIGTENDIACALAMALRTMREVEGVLTDPKPEVIVASLGDYAVLLTVFGWMDSNRTNFLKVKSEAIRKVKEAFDREGISMPEPIRNYRELRDGEQDGESGTATEPSRADMEAITDTSADPVIDRKVDEVRRSGEPDLLAADAPRE